MIYKKPSKMTYTQMAIFVDAHAYDEDMTEEMMSTIFEYLYHLINMLAHKANYFKASTYYDDFAIYMATSVFMRYRNKKQYEFNEDGEPKLTQIKSCLNYIKQTIYPRKVEFEQQFYSQAISPATEDNLLEVEGSYSLGEQMSESIEALSMLEFNMCLNDICETAKAFLMQIPYKSDPIEWQNIYISCMLTFLNSITLSPKNRARIAAMKRDVEDNPQVLAHIYKEELEDSVILFHLNKNMRDYIQVLTNEMKHAIAKDLSLTLHTYIPAGIGLNLTMLADINGGSLDNYSEEV